MDTREVMPMKYQIAVGDQKFEVEIGEVKDGLARVSVNQIPYEVRIDNWGELATGQAPAAVLASTVSSGSATAQPSTPAAAVTQGVVSAPIPGLIQEVLVRVGESVTAGQVVARMEAMKMENNLVSPTSGTVREIRVQKGAEVATGDVLMIIR
jgi:biotin carboxyl carrier protein